MLLRLVPISHLLIAQAGGDAGGALLEPFIGLGIKILALMATIAFAREAYKLATGQQAKFLDVAARWAIAAVLVCGIPHIATWLQSTIQQAGNTLFEIADTASLEGSYKYAMSSFKCDNLDWMDLIAMFATPTGWLLLFAQLVSLASMLVKLVIIDVLWPIVLNLTIIAGAVTVPVGFLDELDGLKTYLRNVASVACWPLLFALLMTGIAASFPQTLKAVEEGKIKANCDELDKDITAAETVVAGVISRETGLSRNRVQGAMNGRESGVLSNVDTSAEASTSFSGMLHYIAICIGHILLSLAIPLVAGSLFGAGGGASIISAMSGGKSQANKAVSAGRGAAAATAKAGHSAGAAAATVGKKIITKGKG